MDSTKAGIITLEVLIPKLLNANISELEDNLLYANKVDNRTDIGNDSTKNEGNFKNIICKASWNGRPYSTTFLIKSIITPTESDTTVKAEIANIEGGKSCPNNHLSIIGIFLKIFGKNLIIYFDIILINLVYNDIHEKDNFFLK